MAGSRCLLLAALFSLGFDGAPARAIVLPVEARMTIEIAQLTPVVFDSTGSAVVNGSGGGLSLSSLALGAGVLGGGPLLVPVTDPAAAPITGFVADVSNDAGTFGTGGGGLGGVMPLVGEVRICFFGLGSCASPLANLSVPLGAIGAGGADWSSGPVNLTVFGAPWTSGTAAVGVITRMGFAMGPASASGSTAQAGGRVQLVTPIYVTTNIGASAVVPAFATLTLHFVPEPASLACLAVGIAMLGWAGARRR